MIPYDAAQKGIARTFFGRISSEAAKQTVSTMSIQSIRSRIERTQRDIESYQSKLTNESKTEAQKAERGSKVRQSISKTTSPSTIKTKQREIERLEHGIVQIQKKKADLTKRIADRTAALHKYQQQLSKEQDRDQKKWQDSLRRQNEEARRSQEELLLRLNPAVTVAEGEGGARQDMGYDAFISHASEDKEDLVRPLAEKLQQAGFSIWYDEFQLKVGDGLRRSIDRGLANSRFGIVVLSPDFFAKNWPQYELDGLVAKEMSGGKVVLPLWHKVSKDEVMRYSPSLADKVALSTVTYTIDELVEKLGEVLR